MKPSELKLIRRLQVRNADRARATAGGIHRSKPFPSIAAKGLQTAERTIGFRLPALLRALYLQVGNGGFGPEYGILGTKGGAKLVGHTLETCYREMLRLCRQNSAWRWPARLLPLGEFGSGCWSCVDCEYARLPIILWDPNNLDEDLEGAEARENWGQSFWQQRESLTAWLEGWLADEPAPDPIWTKPAWTKMRLGFTLPKPS